ncbi:LEM domain [Desmophyllum pertusum]|uniref:LEM domain n=1 Tax=Desmophyllum pertusum TaxID=174260 RepID=A0A9W9ZXH6_9CNID|nr:LEM domain [Desmophyllum pertusum]
MTGRKVAPYWTSPLLMTPSLFPESLLKLSDSELKKELEKYGEIPGPIMPSTKNVYIKRLVRLQSGSANSKDTQYGEYLPELRKHLEGRADTPDMFTVEEIHVHAFRLQKGLEGGVS